LGLKNLKIGSFRIAEKTGMSIILMGLIFSNSAAIFKRFNPQEIQIKSFPQLLGKTPDIL